MKIISWNIRGLGSKNKRRVIKEMLVSKSADIVILQETKKVEVDRKLVGSIWGAKFKNWVSIPSTGRSGRAGGILIMWNTKIVSVLESVVGDFTVSIKIEGCNDQHWWLSGVYGPNNVRERINFWEEVAGLFGLCGPKWCLAGDFNVVRFVSEKSNGGRGTRSMSVFNDFISEANLCDPPLLNAKFTWSNMRDAAVWRRLDRFLFSADWEECFPNVRQCALTRVTSDHCPIELNTNSLKWGPGPFRVENMWLKHPSFKENFTGWWETDSGPGWEGFKFMNKLRGVKTKLKVWSKEVFGDVLMEKKSVEMKIKELDNKDEREGLNAELKRERESLRNKFEELLFNEEMLWRQRAKIKWAKEGDNNTKFFHCLATGRRKINLIEKLVVEGGRVVEDAESIELEMIQYYKNLYSSSNQEIRGVVGLDWSPISGQEAE